MQHFRLADPLELSGIYKTTEKEEISYSDKAKRALILDNQVINVLYRIYFIRKLSITA